MAFQVGGSALPGLSAVTTEMWPSMSSAMRVFGKQNAPQSKSRERVISQSASTAPATVLASKIEIPECLRDLRSGFAAQVSPVASVSSKAISEMPINLRQTFSAMPRSTLNAANPIIRRAFLPQSRLMSTTIRSRFVKPDFAPRGIPQIQRRSIFGSSSVNHSALARLEEAANRNPNSAVAQAAFYQALLRANETAILVERYETGNYASNNTCENLYHRALGSNAVDTSKTAPQTHFSGEKQGGLNSFQLQAVGQAVAAQSRGSNVAVSRSTGTGAKDGPLHVVVEETIGGSIFKWIKFLLYFGLVTYISLIIVSLVVETFQTMRRPGGAKGDNEAKAEHQNVRFTDVHGCDEAKEELQELVDFLKNPDNFNTLGGKLPKGVLLVGPPGTGKTLLARAVAGEAGVPFFFMSGSEFDEVYVGVGAKRVRELFSAAKAKSPAIVFIDELDAIGGKRNARDAAYVKQTLNQLLTELDGFEQNSGVIILAATNFPEMLDKALTRPGRFDRNVVVGLPDVRGRLAILKHHIKKIIVAPDVSLDALAQGTPGFSGAELENIINQAAVHASKAKAQAVSALDFEWAKDKVMMGAEKKSMVITQREKLMTAYHEAGHALVLMFTPGTEELQKVTIMPRGGALGITYHLPEMDKYSKSMHEYHSTIDVCMGGKVAEELIYGPREVTSGCASDLEHATRVAYAMVTRMGMSDKLGNVYLDSNYENLSSGTKELIESEVRRFIEESRIRVTTLLESKRKELELLAKALVDYEMLNKEEAFKVVRGEKLKGRTVMPEGSIKVPVGPGGSGLGGGLPELGPISGTPQGQGAGGKAPPPSVPA